ncbi:15317_t:CDS:2, partial [Cetraspora pellucida]
GFKVTEYEGLFQIKCGTKNDPYDIDQKLDDSMSDDYKINNELNYYNENTWNIDATKICGNGN